MKFYKSLQMLLILCLVASCSTDVDEPQNATQPEDRIVQNQFDNSHLGVYKGLFTTNDGLTRGSVEVILTPANEGIATITLSSGEQIELKSSRVKLTADNKINELRFSSEGLNAINVALEFSVDGNGTEPAISNVSFDNQASDILIAKNLSRAPLTPITGTYVRTAGTGGFPTSAKTWNVMSIGEGSGQNFATQVFYAGRIYNTPAESNMQNNCADGTGLTACDVDGSLVVLGYGVTWSGTHQYSLGSETCSSVSGTWSAPSYGNSSGTFTSDVDASDCISDETETEIGAQNWSIRNLDVVTYRNGDPIPQVTDAEEWSNLTTGAWCYYNNDPANNATYGKLYNWYAATDPRGLAPEGYHVPENSEWFALITFLNSTSGNVGGVLKSTTGWDAPNTGATNSSGFTALPGGRRLNTGIFVSEGSGGYFHGLNGTTSAGSQLFILSSTNANMLNVQNGGNQRSAYSVRVVED
ncbi:MAG: fibrobacter succinogenes major paralogous domain-containing protein [Aquaticitalea sp.]